MNSPRFLAAPGLKPCEECGSTNWFLATLKAANGGVRHPYVCALCGKRTQRYEKKAVFEKTPAQFKVSRVIDLTRSEPCAVCGSSDGVEEHHWAPYAIFGAESDSWPTSPLCVRCHMRWHRMMESARTSEA